MRIAVKKGALGASSSAQLSTASLYSMPTVDDLCAVLKDGSSESNVASAEEIAEPLPTDVVTMIENGSLLDLFSTMNESVSVDDDTSNTSPSSRKSIIRLFSFQLKLYANSLLIHYSGASNMITLYSGIEEQNQNGIVFKSFLFLFNNTFFSFHIAGPSVFQPIHRESITGLLFSSSAFYLCIH